MRYARFMTTTLITGASGGLGAAFARLLATEKHNLVLVARSKDALEALAAELRITQGITVTVLTEDLSDPLSVGRIVAALKDMPIDMLVNNAGVGKLARFAAMSERDIADMLHLNIETLTLLTRALLPGMIARKHGRILNVASTASFQPGPLMAVYYASKAYVLHWSLALSNELRGTGVAITCLCPGPTKTGFQKTAGMLDSPLFKKLHTMDAETVVRIGYDALQRGKPMVVPGAINNIGAFCTRLIPKTLAGRIARKAQEVR